MKRSLVAFFVGSLARASRVKFPYLKVPGECLMRKVVRTKDIDFTLSTNFDLDEWVKSLSGKLKKAILTKSRTYLEKVIRRRFRERLGPKRKRWRPLSPITIAFKKAKGYPRRPLVRSGRLERSVKARIVGSKLTFYTNVPYAKIQQEGAQITTTPKQQVWMWYNLFNKAGNPFLVERIKIPARPFLWFAKQDTDEVKKIVIKEVKKSEKLGKGRA